MADATPSKVKPSHLERDAFLYARSGQSTLQQVVHNTETFGSAPIRAAPAGGRPWLGQ